MADGLEKLAEYFDGMLEDISPARRRVVARKVGQRLRRSNLKRQASNEEPDGGRMEPRRKHTELRGDRSRSGKKMFRKLRYARFWKIRPSAEGVTVQPSRGASRIAGEHHFGLEGYVGRTRDRRTIRHRYTARRLLGFGPSDLDEIADEMLGMLDRD